MALLDIIAGAAGAGALEQVGARVGLTPAQTRSAAATLLPALAGGLKRQAGSADLGGLLQAGLKSGPDRAAGDQILGRIFGSKDVSRTVAAQAAASTGIGADKLKALLPLLASLAAGALASKAAAGAAGGQGAGLLALLDQDGDGDPLNDILGMAGKFLGR